MESVKPTVGRIVHFYDVGLKGKSHRNEVNLNGQGAGPYAALVTQDFDGPYVNLAIFGYGGMWSEGSVSELSDINNQRYWVYPTRA